MAHGQEAPCSTARALAPRRLQSEPAARQPQGATRRDRLTCAAEPAAAAPAPAAAPGPKTAPKPKLVTPAWQTVLDLQESGKVVEAAVESVNRSGAIIKVSGLQGFVPYYMLNPQRLRDLAAAEGQAVSPGEAPATPAGGWTALKGQKLRVKVGQVNVPLKRISCSEKATLLDELAAAVQPGDVLSGTVTALHEWGAFLETDGAGGKPRAEVIIPLKELSWDWVPSAFTVLSVGQRLRAQVIFVQRPPAKVKVVVSLKKLAGDPLAETLDSVLPLEAATGGATDAQGFAAAPAGDSVAASMASGVEEVLEALAALPGVRSVELGRRAEEQRTVSQDLELWLTKDVVADGFNLVARAGRVVQEVHVVTDLDRSAMKEAVQRVMRTLA